MTCGECYGQIVCTVNVQEKPWNMTYMNVVSMNVD
jgi:hypothetical protein